MSSVRLRIASVAAAVSGGFCALPAAATTVVDYVFILDSSGSIRTDGWSDEKGFVNFGLGQALDPSSAVGLVSFSSAVTTRPIIPLANGGATTLENQLSALPYQSQRASTLAALQAARSLFTDYGHPDHARVIMLMTDGAANPASQNPCSATDPAAASLRAGLGADHIRTALITVGDQLDPGIFGCLTNGNDPDLVAPMSDFVWQRVAWYYETPSDLERINAKALALLPAAPPSTPPPDPAAAPEPATWALMLIGFGTLGAALRSRRRARGMACPAPPPRGA
jgi:hypothetical protein